MKIFKMASRVVSYRVVWCERVPAQRARVSLFACRSCDRVTPQWARAAPPSLCADAAADADDRCRTFKFAQLDRCAGAVQRRGRVSTDDGGTRRTAAPTHTQISLAPPRSQLDNYRYRHLSADVRRCSCRVFETQLTPLESARDGHATTRAFAHSWRRMPLNKFTTLGEVTSQSLWSRFDRLFEGYNTI